MADAGGGERSRWALYRDRKRGGPPRKLKPCGTPPAYRRHRRAGEDPCDACKDAYSDWQHEQYLKRQGIAPDEIRRRLRARARARKQK